MEIFEQDELVDLPPPKTSSSDAVRTGLPGRSGGFDDFLARNTLHPLLPHRRPLQAPAPAHCEPARRAQMCLRHGQAGSRGSADPLEAYGVEYLIGIVDEQVRSALPLHTLCKPRPATPACDPDRADPPHLTAAAPVHRIFCMPVEFESRRRAPVFVLFCRGQIVASERVRRVCLCVSASVSFGVRPPLWVHVVIEHL